MIRRLFGLDREPVAPLLPVHHTGSGVTDHATLPTDPHGLTQLDAMLDDHALVERLRDGIATRDVEITQLEHLLRRERSLGEQLRSALDELTAPAHLTAEQITQEAGRHLTEPAPTAEHAATATALLEQLARALAQWELAIAGSTWDKTREEFRSFYRRMAEATALAGWRPPLLPPRERVVQIAAVLAAHDLAIYDGGAERDLPQTCRCGWDGLVIHHPEHVAEHLATTGPLA